MKPALVEVEDFGGSLVAIHNHPCSVCRWRTSVLDMATGVFHPCWKCQSIGWQTVLMPRWLLALARWCQ